MACVGRMLVQIQLNNKRAVFDVKLKYLQGLCSACFGVWQWGRGNKGEWYYVIEKDGEYYIENLRWMYDVSLRNRNRSGLDGLFGSIWREQVVTWFGQGGCSESE